MTKREAIENVVAIIEKMDDNDIININNEYCDANYYYDDKIYPYEMLDDLCSGLNPIEIIERYGELAYCDYFREGVYIEEASANDVDIEVIAEYMVEEEESFGYSEIENEIDEYLVDMEEDEEE